MTPPIVDRRDMLKLGGAAALALLAPSVVAFTARASMIVLADPRYGESLIFAGGLERQGAKVVTLASDLGGTWFNGIAPQLLHGLQGVAGLTLEIGPVHSAAPRRRLRRAHLLCRRP